MIVNTAIALLLATPIATALSRNAAFPLLLLIALLLAVAVRLQSGSTKALSDVARRTFRLKLNVSATTIALTSLLFALVSLLWSPDAPRGLSALVGASTAALVSVVCCVLVTRRINTPAWFMWALPLAISISCLLVVSELTFGSPIRGALGASTEEFRLNRAVVASALMLPLLFLIEGGKKRLLTNLGVVALVWLAIFMSISEAAKLAAVVVTGTLVLSIFVRSRWLALLCGFSVLATHLFAPLIAIAMYTSIPREAVASLSMALAGHPDHFIRVEIWWAHALQILEAPILGQGLQASLRAVDAYHGSDPTVIRGLSYGHPHNVSIQIWYELGLVGVALSSALIFLSVSYISRLPVDQQRAPVALMSGVWSVAYVSHGAWQHWWWALVGAIVIIFSVLNAKIVDNIRDI
ncbi:MAG: O-antigen ligase family protein [Hyphomicrobiales bacterium]